MNTHLTLTASLCIAAASTATAQSIPLENTYAYSAGTHSQLNETFSIDRAVSLGALKLEYQINNTLLFGDVLFGKSSSDFFEVTFQNYSIGAAQTFGAAQLGFDFDHSVTNLSFGTSSQKLATLFANYETDRFGLTFNASSRLNGGDLVFGNLGGEVALSDQFQLQAIGLWTNNQGLQSMLTSLNYDNGPLSASLFATLDFEDRNIELPGVRINYDITPRIGVGAIYQSRNSAGYSAELSGSYDITDAMSFVAAYGRSENGPSETEVIGFSLVYEVGESGRFDQRLANDMTRNTTALAIGDRLFD